MIFSRKNTRRKAVSALLVNSLPKSGTNLLAKAVRLLTGAVRSNLRLNHPGLLPECREAIDDADGIPLGVDWPRRVPCHLVDHALNKIGSGEFAVVHIPYSKHMARMIKDRKMKTLLILRDPRDVVVSHADYIYRREDHFLNPHYRKLNKSERLMKSIVGIANEDPNTPTLLNIFERCSSVLPWKNDNLNYTTHFEKLVGAQGGGSNEDQINELANIASHLEVSTSDTVIEQTADNLFGGTRTFNRGLIGGWETFFSNEHLKAFHSVAGNLLARMGYE